MGALFIGIYSHWHRGIRLGWFILSKQNGAESAKRKRLRSRCQERSTRKKMHHGKKMYQASSGSLEHLGAILIFDIGGCLTKSASPQESIHGFYRFVQLFSNLRKFGPSFQCKKIPSGKLLHNYGTSPSFNGSINDFHGHFHHQVTSGDPAACPTQRWLCRWYPAW